MNTPFVVGERVWFADETRPMTVQAVSSSGRFVVCTKPFAARKTVLYSMLDTVLNVRGVDNTIGNSMGYETREQCEHAAQSFELGDHEFSRRRQPIPLHITKREVPT